jgi:hypothetical protein
MQYDTGAIDQVMDYALDLKNFHAGSHARRLVPILVATRADNVRLDLEWAPDGVASPASLCRRRASGKKGWLG